MGKKERCLWVFISLREMLGLFSSQSCPLGDALFCGLPMFVHFWKILLQDENAHINLHVKKK